MLRFSTGLSVPKPHRELQSRVHWGPQDSMKQGAKLKPQRKLHVKVAEWKVLVFLSGLPTVFELQLSPKVG